MMSYTYKGGYYTRERLSGADFAVKKAAPKKSAAKKKAAKKAAKKKAAK